MNDIAYLVLTFYDFNSRLLNHICPDSSSGSYILSGQSSVNPETGTYTASPAGQHYIKVIRYSGTGIYQLNTNFVGSTGYGSGEKPPPAGDCNYGARPSKPSKLTSYMTLVSL